jgi:hypothetical protein
MAGVVRRRRGTRAASDLAVLQDSRVEVDSEPARSEDLRIGLSDAAHDGKKGSTKRTVNAWTSD